MPSVRFQPCQTCIETLHDPLVPFQPFRQDEMEWAASQRPGMMGDPLDLVGRKIPAKTGIAGQKVIGKEIDFPF